MRLRAAFGLIFLLTGCGGMDIETFRGQSPEFRLEQFFEGESKAWGWFEDRFGTIQRRFTVDLTGTVEGDTLTLDERFVYNDGERETRVWTIRALPDGVYEGTAPGVVGAAGGRVVGPALNWTYTFEIPMQGRTVALHFNDWMIQEDENTVINRATVSKWGITVGTVVLFFQKVASEQTDTTRTGNSAPAFAAGSAYADASPQAFEQAAE